MESVTDPIDYNPTKNSISDEEEYENGFEIDFINAYEGGPPVRTLGRTSVAISGEKRLYFQTYISVSDRNLSSI